MVENIVSLELDSRDDITQESSTVIITVDVAMTADITANIVILDDTGVATNSYAWRSNQYE